MTKEEKEAAGCNIHLSPAATKIYQKLMIDIGETSKARMYERVLMRLSCKPGEIKKMLGVK